MLPPGHAAVGYLTFSLLRRIRHRDLPTPSSVPWLLLGTQLPDLIDKPLAWWVGVLPSGRSLGHSVLFVVPLVVLVDALLRRRDRPVDGEAFAVGTLSHLLTDALPAVRDGPRWVAFLVWPAAAAPRYVSRPTVWPPTELLEPTELAVALGVALLWNADGRPGLEYGRRALDRLRAE